MPVGPPGQSACGERRTRQRGARPACDRKSKDAADVLVRSVNVLTGKIENYFFQIGKIAHKDLLYVSQRLICRVHVSNIKHTVQSRPRERARTMATPGPPEGTKNLAVCTS